MNAADAAKSSTRRKQNFEKQEIKELQEAL